MSSRLKLAVRHAVGEVTEFMRSRNMQPGDELPTLLSLSKAAGVSRVTMWSALNEMKKLGSVTGVAGHPFRVGAPDGTLTEATSRESGSVGNSPAPQSTAWKRTQETILREVLAAVFPPGAILPSTKELEVRYSVAYKTLKKALDALVADRILERRRKGYAVPSLAVHVGRPRIAFFTFSFDSFTMFLGQHDGDLYRSLEKQCVNAKIALDVYLLFPESLTPVGEAHALVRERRTGRVWEINDLINLDDPMILGFMLMVPGATGDLEDQLLRVLALHKKPVAILDETAGWVMLRELARSRYLRLFTITASPEPARTVARYLLGLGHQRVAFISPVHRYAWSQRRLEGVRSVYAAAGHAEGVAAFVEDGGDDPPLPLGSVVDAYNTARAALAPALRIDADAWISRLDSEVSPKARNRARLYSLLEQAVADSSITAWVMVNDHAAFEALEFLASRGVKVPGRISVVSFDDAVEAVRLNLTSYNFNAAGMGTAMLGYILNRKPYVYVDKKRIAEIDGYIVERQTTGSAPAIASQDKPLPR